MASHIRGAEFVELDGDDHWFFAGAQQPLIEAVKQFVNALPRDGTRRDKAATNR